MSKFEFFLESDDRIAIFKITDEVCEYDRAIKQSNDLAQDLESLAKSMDPKDARYLAVRSNDSDQGVVFVAYVPQDAPVRVKMKYASSTNSIHKQLGGSSRFSTIAFWTEHKEVSIEGWNEHIAHEGAEVPLTEDEQSLKTAVEHEAHRMGTRQSNTGIAAMGIDAKIDEAGRDALQSLAQDEATKNIAVFHIAESGEIQLAQLQEAATDSLHSHFHENEPRYAVLKHETKAVFVYVCPDDASVRHRMVYASTRIPFLNYVKSVVSIAGVVSTLRAPVALN